MFRSLIFPRFVFNIHSWHIMKLPASHNCLSGQTYLGSQNRSLSSGHDRLRVTTTLTCSIILLLLLVARALICNTMRPLLQSMHSVRFSLVRENLMGIVSMMSHSQETTPGPTSSLPTIYHWLLNASQRAVGLGSTPAWRARYDGGKVSPMSKLHPVKVCKLC